MKIMVDEQYARELPSDHSLYQLLVQHAGWLLSRFTVRASGRTSYEVLKGRP